MTISGDDFDDEPRRKKRRDRTDARAKSYAEHIAAREVGDAKDWERFIDEATGLVNWEKYEHYLKSEGWRFVETYQYHAHDGQPAFEILRYQHRLQPKLKKFIPRYKNFDGKLIIKESPVRVPYALPELLRRPDEPIIWCEGEKAANRAMAAGLLATCVHGQRWSNIVAGYFADRDVFVVPDNDDAGELNASKALDYLVKAGARPRLIHLDGLKRTDDLFDWLEAGHTKDELLSIAEKQQVHGPDLAALKWHGEPGAANDDKRWLVKGLLAETGAGLISGQWGMAKTFFGLDLAASIFIQAQETFIDYPIARHGGVLFIAAEGASSIRLRLNAVVSDKLGLPITDDAPPMPFAWIDCQPNLLLHGAATLMPIVNDAVARMKERFRCDLALVIVDTVAAAAAFEDENDAAQAQKVMSALGELSRRTGAFVIGIDHFGKDQDTGTRGSSAKEGYSEAVLALMGDRQVTGKADKLRMGVRKIKDGEVGRVVPLRLLIVDCGVDADHRQVTTCVIRYEPERVDAKPGRPSTRKDAFKAALTQALAETSEVIQQNGEDVRAVRRQILGEKFLALYAGKEDPGDALRKAISSARNLGAISTASIKGTDFIWQPDPVL